ncbi:MAG TPA: hypothetical protein VIN05_07535 [Roseovarius sp.]
MFRFPLCALLILTAVPPALAAGSVGEVCAKTAAIVANAAAMRTKGSAQADTLAALTASDLEARFVPAVQPLVEWVYTLPADQLPDEIASAAFETACLEQAG